MTRLSNDEILAIWDASPLTGAHKVVEFADSITAIVDKRHSDESVKFLLTWMQAKNPLLGGVSPLTLIGMGRADRLASFIQEVVDMNVWFEHDKEDKEGKVQRLQNLMREAVAYWNRAERVQVLTSTELYLRNSFNGELQDER